jgi:hypothetical protein
MSNETQRPGGPPYLPHTAGVGGLPTVDTDVPICAIFIFIYICFGVTNVILFQRNRRRGHLFVLSILLAGFSWARVATLVLRIAWANRQTNIRLAIAAQIFVNAGVLVVYIVNLILAQRILRAKHPRLGWNLIMRTAFKILYAIIGLALAAVITSVVISFYTLNTHTRTICRDIQLAALTYVLLFTCLPIFHMVAVISFPKSDDEELFGEGSMRSKSMIVSASSALCILIAGFKTGTSWSPAPPLTDPAWYDSKASFYIFDFTIEILILSLLTFSRIDKRFFIPNGSKGPGDYTRLGQTSLTEKEDC